MLPQAKKSSHVDLHSACRFRSNSNLSEYLRRILDYKQMDFEAGVDQMKTLASCNPARVYKTSYFRKQMKGHWARDDPAFAVLQMGLLVAAAFAYGLVLHFRDLGFVGMVTLIFRAVLMDWLLFGAAVATLGWILANAFLRQSRGVVPEEDHVEWFYAFDIHCNSYVPLFVFVHVAQFCLLPLLNSESCTSALLANALYAVAFCAYFYITHLGYRALPFLTKTELYLYPIVGIAFLFCISALWEPPAKIDMSA